MLKKWLKRFKENEKGLTLVELLAVIVILAIVGSIAFVAIGNVIDNSKEDAHIANAQQIISAVKLAEASGDVKFDETNYSVNVLNYNSENEILPQLEEIVDPWENKTYTMATVYKGDTGYNIDLEDEGDNCNLDNATEQELRQNGRDLCD